MGDTNVTQTNITVEANQIGTLFWLPQSGDVRQASTMAVGSIDGTCLSSVLFVLPIQS